MNTLATTGNLVAANDINWNTFLPDKLVPAIFDTMYMVALTMVIAGLLGLVIGALLYLSLIHI